MMANHFFRSTAKLSLLVWSSRSIARCDSITRPAEGDADHPFCGAEISTSTPVAFISTQAQPEAMQSSTISAPTSCAALARAVRVTLVEGVNFGITIVAEIPANWACRATA